MNAKIHTPHHSALSSYITAIWETIPPGVSSEMILPKGVVELIFNLSDSMVGVLPHQTSPTKAPDCFIQGFNTHVVKVQYTSTQHLLGVCLEPHMVKSLVGILPSECRDGLIDLTLLKPFFKDIWYQLKEAKNFEERVRILEKTFPRIDNIGCERTRHFCSLITDNTDNIPISVNELTKDVCYSSRQLNRKSQSFFGLSTEELLIHKKFRKAVSLLHHDTLALTSIAYEAGFYDQAHFCHTFKEYTGLTAKEYRLMKSELPFHIFS